MRTALVLSLLAAPVFADGHLFQAPQGCTGFLTVQAKDCTVEHYWTCEGDTEGHQWRVSIGAFGPEMVALIDRETQWVETYSFDPPSREALISPAVDPASFTELVETGNDSFDFQQQGDAGITRIVGYDSIVEEDVVIDGEPLKRTQYSIREEDAEGNEIYRASGSEYVSVTHRRFFSGYGDVEGVNGAYSYDSRPVEFIYPGEPGYFSKTPKHGCGADLASYPIQRKE